MKGSGILANRLEEGIQKSLLLQAGGDVLESGLLKIQAALREQKHRKSQQPDGMHSTSDITAPVDPR